MQSLPKYSAERVRLMAHLEKQKNLINGDMSEIKSSLKPLTLAKRIISEAADTFRDNTFATQTARLALTVLPRSIRHPLLGIAAQIAVPLLLRNAPRILNMIQGKDFSDVGVATTKAELIGNLRKKVSRLRDRLHNMEVSY
ncbi:MAG: hypothetical protein LH618_02100 [Saprospiraceae bacterium]|nr:hypothetical protein [Saprospiraceae bacterium]